MRPLSPLARKGTWNRSGNLYRFLPRGFAGPGAEATLRRSASMMLTTLDGGAAASPSSRFFFGGRPFFFSAMISLSRSCTGSRTRSGLHFALRSSISLRISA